jgi:pSer/pThr/pTyr-binding forkhead associated (FHA) protein
MLDMAQPAGGVPVLTLANESLNIRIVGINGAIIGRRNGPYTQFFVQCPYVSGTHAQLRYDAASGWCITDKHSSNGTKLNQRQLQPDVEMSLNNGDTLTLANVNLQVIVR